MALVTCLLIMPGAPVMAQTAALEEIVVTAQKREETLQTVPVTMQAYTGDQLESFNIYNATDIARLAPNVNVVVQNALSQHIVIRGVGTNEFFGNAASSVGMYMDEVTMNSSYMSTLGLFDVERVEILRGPQNSLFGRNTTGGAVNYISRLPTVGGDTEGYVSLTYGRHDRADLDAAVSIPMGDTAALRLAGMTRNMAGRWNNITEPDDEYGDVEKYSFRGTLVFQPNDATTVSGSIHIARDRGEAQAQKAFGTLDSGGDGILRLIPDEQTIFGNLAASDIDFETPVPWVTSQGLDVVTTRWDDVRTGASQRADLDVDGGYVKLVHDFGGMTLTGIAAYDETHGFYEEDNGVSGLSAGPNTEALVIDMDQLYEQTSFELRLASSDNDAAFRWIAGIYYFNQDSLLAQNIRFGDNGVLAFHPAANNVPPSVLCGPGTPANDPNCTDDFPGIVYASALIPNPYGNTASFSIADLEDQSFSVYGQTDYDFTDRFTVTVGVRYTDDTIKNPSYFAGAFDITGEPQSNYYDEALVRQFAASLPACQPISPTNPPFQHCANNNTSRSDIDDQEIGGKLGLTYHATDDVMLYGSYSRGFKSGKFDVEFLHTDTTPFPQRSLEEEILDAFEIGFKSTLQDGRMQFNGAAFYYTWDNLQVFNVGPAGPEFFNLPEAEIRGLELETKWAPAEDWLVSLGVGFLDSEITDVTGADFDIIVNGNPQGQFQKGHELVLAPDFTGNFAIIKDIQISANTLTLQVDGQYQSESKAKYRPSHPIDEYVSRFELNARGSYIFGAEQQYELNVILQNITEEKYCLEKQDLAVLVGAYYCVPNLGEMQWALQGTINF
jgi:iron complex outermembrane receptor protein